MGGDETTVSVRSLLSLSEVIPILAAHGCPDITSRLDEAGFSEYPLHGGGFGDIYLGRIKGDIPVAVKCARHRIQDDSNRQNLKLVAREIHAWSKCNHENVLALLGLAQYRGQLAMISPWMENGTLPEYIEKEPDVDRLGLCHQIVKGLSYLHQHNMVRGDLKGANVFVSATGILKLADFGNTKMKEQTLCFSTRTSPVYSLRWTAPEILNGLPCDAPADIYALGMTIYETVTGSLPYSDKVDMVVVIEVIVHRRLPSRNDEAIRVRCNKNRLWNPLKSCWNHTPTARPKITNVEEQIKLLMNELATVNEERTFIKQFTASRLLHKFRQAFRNPPRPPATLSPIAGSISLLSAAAPSVEEDDSEPSLISGQDALIMASAFRQMMRKPDLTMRPEEEGESPEDKYVREQAEMIKEQLLEDGKKILRFRVRFSINRDQSQKVDA